MRVPPWLTIGVAVLVIAFGLYRLWLATRKVEPRSEEDAPKRSGYYRMAARTHLLVGIVYLLLGAALIATSFGWNPLGGMFSSDGPAAPATKGGIQISPPTTPTTK